LLTNLSTIGIKAAKNGAMAKDVSLVDDLGNFAERARDLLRLTIEQGLRNDTRPNRDVVHWYIGLGTLAWDVSGSIMRLVSVSDVRAASMLNRSLFEYWIGARDDFRGNSKRSGVAFGC